MKRGDRGRKIGDITSSLDTSLGSYLAQPRIRLGKFPAAYELHRLHQGPRGVARLFLQRLVAVERVMAGGVGLVVADIAVELGGVTGRDQADVAQAGAEGQIRRARGEG